MDVVSLLGVTIALFLSGALICAGIWGFMRLLVAKQRAHEASRQAASNISASGFPPPRLEVQSSVALEKLRTSEDALEFVRMGRSHASITRIPIDRAMQLTIDHGLPDVGRGQTPLQLMQSLPQQNAVVPANPRR